MKKKYVNPTLEVFEYIPEGHLLTPSEIGATIGGGTDDSGNEYELGGGDGWTNKRESNTPWGKSPWE